MYTLTGFHVALDEAGHGSSMGWAGCKSLAPGTNEIHCTARTCIMVSIATIINSLFPW
jgi:hypothetical protein